MSAISTHVFSDRGAVTCGHDHGTPFPSQGEEGYICPVPPPIPEHEKGIWP